jgi:hypothetical protein
MIAFLYKILAPTNYKAKHKERKSAQRLSCEKETSKMLMKLTPAEMASNDRK